MYLTNMLNLNTSASITTRKVANTFHKLLLIYNLDPKAWHHDINFSYLQEQFRSVPYDIILIVQGVKFLCHRRVDERIFCEIGVVHAEDFLLWGWGEFVVDEAGDVAGVGERGLRFVGF